MRKLFVVLMVLAVVGGMAAYADTLKKGDKEATFRFSYSSISPDTGDDIKETILEGGMGYLITDAHEVGGLLSYSKYDVGSDSTDSNQIGVFYHYNFKAGDMMNPYLGVNVAMYGGDTGDMYDSSYGVEAGLKLYPWANAGFNFGVRWDNLMGANDIGDGTYTALFGGVLFKF
jgi:hypothetical protein